LNIRISTSTFFALFIIAALFLGWNIRDQNLWTAEEGLGYAMGITGSTMMALLLLYPLRKRLRFMHSWLPVKYWFGTHMVFGVLGPVIILYHCSFGPGSLNSNVALYSMLIVSLSGLLGRFFYVHIHKGLYGRKILLSELRQDVDKKMQEVQLNSDAMNELVGQLDGLETVISGTPKGLSGRIVLWARSLNKSRQIKRRLKHIDKKLVSKNEAGFDVDKKYYHSIKKYLSSISEVSEYMVYEGMFSWWHIIHIPLFFLLVISVTVHIIAVHMY
jgi:hypothetical protein